MRRGTTPTVSVEVSGAGGTPLDLTTDRVHLTFKEQGKGGTMVDKTGDDLTMTVTQEGTTIVSTTLTQEDTLSFKAGKTVRVQVRAADTDGKAVATDIASVEVEEILLEGVI